MFKFRRRRDFLYICLLAVFFTSAIWLSYRRRQFAATVPSFDLHFNPLNYLKYQKFSNETILESNYISVSNASSSFKDSDHNVQEEVDSLELENNNLPETIIKEEKKRRENVNDEKTVIINNRKPVVLMWTKYYEVKGDALMKLLLSSKKWNPNCCSEVNVTLDRGLQNEAIAIVFFHYFGNLELKDLPTKRSPEQLWILFHKESPAHSNVLDSFDNLFNLTMGYRHDSDIWSPYGFTFQLEKPLENEEMIMIRNYTLDQWISGKSKMMAGVISHCPTLSRREKAAKEIAKDVNVDIYGGCGKHICPRNANKEKGQCDPDEIWIKISKEYKFYFSAENSICLDYITEKFWRPLEIGLVPVVYGGGNYSLYAPPGSYIDSRNFKSPHDLAIFLKKLDKETDEYRKYFEWRRKYSVRKTDAWHGWCKLCSHVKNYSNLTETKNVSIFSTKIYHELGKWWSSMPGSSDKPIKACSSPFWKL